jgi:hypothetical protein
MWPPQAAVNRTRETAVRLPGIHRRRPADAAQSARPKHGAATPPTLDELLRPYSFDDDAAPGSHDDAPGSPHTRSGVGEAIRLASLDREQLLDEAAHRGIPGRRAMTRRQLVAALLDADEPESCAA